MATPYKIVLSSKDLGVNYCKGYDVATAAKLSELLQQNLESFDMVFKGLRHNHIVHYLLTMYGLGATSEEIQHAFDREALYQRSRFPVDENIVSAMADKEKFPQYLSQQPNYSNFLLFWQREIEAKGVRATLEEHVFADDAHARELLPRFFTSIFHGYLHLGFAFEFNQPAIVAEALGMACNHDPESNLTIPIFHESERIARERTQKSTKTLRELLEETRKDKVLEKSIEGRHIRDRSKNIAENAMEQMIKYTAQYSIADDQLEERLEEMIDTCSVLIATRPSRIPEGDQHKIDFYFLHTVNTLNLMPTLMNHEWISRANAVRWMEWAGRLHILTYVAQTAPPLTTALVDTYPARRGWDAVIYRANNHPYDDGHLVKNIRALAFGEQAMAKKYSEGKHLMKPDAWLKLANLVLDTVRWDADTSEQRWLLYF